MNDAFGDSHQVSQSIDNQAGQILRPIAVIPLNGPEDESHISYLKSFATASNSEMIYACNELGEKVAIGLYVTESFNSNSNQVIGQCKEEKEYEKINLHGRLGAVEECSTEEIEGNKEQINVSKQKENVIRVYKVNKGKKKRASDKTGVHGKQKFTLKEIKQEKKPRRETQYWQKTRVTMS